MSVAAPPRSGGPTDQSARDPAIPFLKTRLPTGKPPWPLVLMAGVDKCGKSYAAAEFSGSPLVGRTFWIEIGEGDANHYGEVPGANYEICDHDGTYRGLMYAAWAATKQVRYDNRPNAIVVDNVTQLWEMLTAEAQAIANRRRKNPDSEATITMDLWNVAKKRWGDFIDVLRQHDGPVLLIARLEYVTLVDSAGQPTKDRDWKIRAEKNLPFEGDVVVTMPAYRTYEISGVRSLRLQIPPGEKRQIPDFTTHTLMERLGLDAAGATQPRIYVAPRPDPADAYALTTGEPGQDVPGPGSRGKRVNGDQVSELLTLLDQVGPADPEARLEFVSGIVGVRVSGPGDLDAQQAQELITALARMAHDVDQPPTTTTPPDEAQARTSTTGGTGPLRNGLDMIPVLAATEVEPPSSRGETEDFIASLAKAKHLDAVDRVEDRFTDRFRGTFINATLFVDLAIAAAARRAELGGQMPPMSPAAAALAAILARAAESTRSHKDIERIHALIHHHAGIGNLDSGESQALMAECKELYRTVFTGNQAAQHAVA